MAFSVHVTDQPTLDTPSTPESPPPSGERRLAVALLEQAFQDLLMGSTANRSNALLWIREGDVGEISFNFCCEVIDWNPDRIRTQVLKRAPQPKRFQNRAFAARKGWLARKRGEGSAQQVVSSDRSAPVEESVAGETAAQETSRNIQTFEAPFFGNGERDEY